MKITPQDYADLKAAIVGIFGNRKLADIAAMYKDNGLSEKRFRWDLLYSVQSVVRQPIFDRMYKYANDTHIDTALRRIVKEIQNG